MPIWWAFHSLPNIHTHLGNRKWVCSIWPELFPIYMHTDLTHNWWWKHKLKVMIRNQKIKGTFTCGPLFFKWMSVFQSWLDCFSIGACAFVNYSKYKLFHLQKSLHAGVHWLQFLNDLTCSLIALFQVHQIASDIFPILQNKPCIYVLEKYLWKRLFKFK